MNNGVDNVVEKAAFSIDESCNYIGTSRPTMYKLMDKGEIRSFHVGRRRMILKYDLDLFLQGRLSEAGYGAGE